MISCKEVSLIISNSNTSKLSFKMKLHLFISNCCNDFKEKMHLLDQKAVKLREINLNKDQAHRVQESKREVAQLLTKSK